MEYSYTACLLFNGKLLMHFQHQNLDEITAKMMDCLEAAGQGAKGIIYDHDIKKIVGTYRKATID